ncbi:unnamed protein product [Musa acuminata subsp. malaccensis]|uniref:(wild Malaysian banana) hypothetical protein n=1 Tax=Musa acuminata subsp. malaccensis TaxID=214687 RepID=A0A804LB25_MUSAM|nr:unnamed protein product [Musa acuminata subsp. malaccensis]
MFSWMQMIMPCQLTLVWQRSLMKTLDQTPSAEHWYMAPEIVPRKGP